MVATESPTVLYRMRCFVKKALARFAPYTFIRTGRSTNYIACKPAIKQNSCLTRSHERTNEPCTSSNMKTLTAEGNSVSFPEKAEKGWGFDIFCMESPVVRGICANTPLTKCKLSF